MKKYKIIPVDEAIELTKKDKRPFNRNEEITNCAVFLLSNRKVILLPFDSNTGALFGSVEDCLEFIAKGKVDEIRTINYIEKMKDDVINIDKTYNKYISELVGIFQIEFPITILVNQLVNINNTILKFGIKKIKDSEEIQFAMGIYIGTIIKKIVDGEWALEEMNKGSKYLYYVPYIKDVESRMYLPFKGIYESSGSGQKFNLVNFIIYGSIHNNIQIKAQKLVMIE